MNNKKPPEDLRKSRTFTMTDSEHQMIKDCAAADGRNATRQVVHLAAMRLEEINKAARK